MRVDLFDGDRHPEFNSSPAMAILSSEDKTIEKAVSILKQIELSKTAVILTNGGHRLLIIDATMEEFKGVCALLGQNGVDINPECDVKLRTGAHGTLKKGDQKFVLGLSYSDKCWQGEIVKTSDEPGFSALEIRLQHLVVNFDTETGELSWEPEGGPLSFTNPEAAAQRTVPEGQEKARRGTVGFIVSRMHEVLPTLWPETFITHTSSRDGNTTTLRRIPRPNPDEVRKEKYGEIPYEVRAIALNRHDFGGRFSKIEIWTPKKGKGDVLYCVTGRFALAQRTMDWEDDEREDFELPSPMFKDELDAILYAFGQKTPNDTMKGAAFFLERKADEFMGGFQSNGKASAAAVWNPGTLTMAPPERLTDNSMPEALKSRQSNGEDEAAETDKPEAATA